MLRKEEVPSSSSSLFRSAASLLTGALSYFPIRSTSLGVGFVPDRTLSRSRLGKGIFLLPLPRSGFDFTKISIKISATYCVVFYTVETTQLCELGAEKVKWLINFG